MSERRRERLDFLQNITIASLTVLAALLLAQAGILQQIWAFFGGYVQVFPSTPAAAALSAAEDSDLSAPVRLVVSGEYGRSANVTMTTGDLSFYPVRRLLEEAMDESNPAENWRRGGEEPCQRKDFLSAAAPPSLYCDFLRPFPLSLLAGLLGREDSREGRVRCLLLSPEGDGVALYLWDGAETYLRRETALTPEAFQSASDAYALGGASFAMDLAAKNPLCTRLTPLSILPDSLPTLPVLSTGGGTASTDQILTALRFNPMTNSRYWESNGTQVIMESGRSVRLREDGSVSYQSGGRADLRVEGVQELPTVRECAAGCKALLDVIAPGGSASLCPVGASWDNGLLILRFGYQTQGVPILLPDGGDAAVVTLEGGSVVSLDVRPRTYTVTETASLLLPLPQTLGIAGAGRGGELTLAYADGGRGEAAACWILRQRHESNQDSGANMAETAETAAAEKPMEAA